ncbi:Polyhydroxyalkanoate synthesis regulator phasin [Gracilibacillus ureilyticus]|uniref:Polyhydroxyalkanoate synthesis regulator phasin n=1 Tax=Gracilibacillus ureilyticus TaxID=531814 RepID=A0A1H9MRJ3_9BACI|nr:polyhydroxyalkanoate synthesis regulator [Gracilibacillus ureilyticus]SER26336.1 Polyhydroxyalkanoate synthesis regulator phasin [Gracilibacillus ureilyticus]
MRDTFRKGVSLGLGLAAVGKEQAEKMIDELIKKGELSKEDSDDLFNQIKQKGEESQQKMDEKINQKIENMLDEYEVVRKEDLRAIEHRLIALEQKLDQ